MNNALKQPFTVALLTLTVAFCSLMYELVLAQTLTALFGSLVLRYSLTIGLYLMGLGLGALSFKYVKNQPAHYFTLNQVILSLLGSMGVLSLLILSVWQYDFPWLVILLAHALVLLIGFFSGLEIPLIGALYKNKFAHVLGLDYFGGLLAGLAFPLWFYPQLGLIYSTLAIAAVNFVVCLWCWHHFALTRWLKILICLIGVGFCAVIWHHNTVVTLLEQFYLTGSIHAT